MTTTAAAPLYTPTTTPLPQRILGKTGESVPLLGLGSAPGGMGLTDEDAIRLYDRAIDLGVTYIDTAPGYGRAHLQLGEVMRRRRQEVFLVTKTPADTADEALQILGKGLADLQTDHVDLVYVHHLGARDVDRVLEPDGALAGLREAQRRGLTRYVGFTAHNTAWKASRILRQAEVDVIMVNLNYGDLHTYDFQGEVLPLALSEGVGVAAMKVYGGADGMKYETTPSETCRPSAMQTEGYLDHETALRYALGLPGVSLAVIGMYTEEELLQNIEWVRRWEAMSAAEIGSLEAKGRELSSVWGTHFGEVS